MEQHIDNRREKIKTHCYRIYWILLAISVPFIILFASHLMYGVWLRLDRPVIDIIGSGHFNVTLLGFDDSPIVIPAVGIGLVNNSMLPRYDVGGFVFASLVWYATALIPIFYVVHLFKELSKGCSPFDKRISRAARVLMVLLIILAINSNWTLFFAAALMGLFARIFDYGRLLQEENDTTL